MREVQSKSWLSSALASVAAAGAKGRDRRRLEFMVIEASRRSGKVVEVPEIQIQEVISQAPIVHSQELAEASAKHTKALESAHGKAADQAGQQGGHGDFHAGLQERLAFVEKSIGS